MTKYFTKAENILGRLQAHNKVNLHTRLKNTTIAPISSFTPLLKPPDDEKNLSAHLLPRVRRSSQKNNTMMMENTPTSPPLTEMKKYPNNPTCPILWEHHQTSPQIDHLHNH